ncbi:MAG TPA: hypothetical protein VHC86_09170 [Opitutaceae bacterium]|nr:hypothetical protein [Opitutaceae bacterium]
MRARWLLAAAALAAAVLPARAHPLSITQVLAAFERPGLVDVKMDIDLTPLLPSPEAYAAIAASAPAAQRAAIGRLLPEIVSGLQLQIGRTPLRLVLQDFKVPALPREAILDPTADHFTLLHFIAALPASRDPIRLVVKPGTPISYPIAFVVQIPAAHLSDASWIQDETEESDEIDWAKSAPQAGANP